MNSVVGKMPVRKPEEKRKYPTIHIEAYLILKYVVEIAITPNEGVLNEWETKPAFNC